VAAIAEEERAHVAVGEQRQQRQQQQQDCLCVKSFSIRRMLLLA
jgi:hypothetical protein